MDGMESPIQSLSSSGRLSLREADRLHTLHPQHLVSAPQGANLPPRSLFLLSQQLDLDLLNWKVDSSGAFSESQC